MKNLSTLILIITFFMGLACNDEPEAEPLDNTPMEKTNTDFLVEGNWQLKSGLIDPSITVDVFGTTVVIESYWDMLAALNGGAVEECQMDNLMLFRSDSSVVLDEGQTKCDPADPQEENGGDWLFQSNETELVFTSFPYDPLMQRRTLKVIDLDAANLKLEMDYRFGFAGSDSTDHLIKLDFENVK